MAGTSGLHKGAYGTNRVTTFCTRAFKVNHNTCHLQMVFFGFFHSHAFKHRSKYFVCWCEIQIRWNSFISKNRKREIKCLVLKRWWQCKVLIKIRTQISLEICTFYSSQRHFWQILICVFIIDIDIAGPSNTFLPVVQLKAIETESTPSK